MEKFVLFLKLDVNKSLITIIYNSKIRKTQEMIAFILEVIKAKPESIILNIL